MVEAYCHQYIAPGLPGETSIPGFEFGLGQFASDLAAVVPGKPGAICAVALKAIQVVEPEFKRPLEVADRQVGAAIDLS